MTAEKATVRPAVATAVRTACSTTGPPSRRRRWRRRPGGRGLGRRRAGRGGEPVGLLTEAGDDEQAVVDRQAEPQHGDDVDDEGVDVHRVGQREHDAETADDGGERTDERDAGGEEPAEDDDHDEQRDGKGHDLAGHEVLADLVDDLLGEDRRRARDAGDPGRHAGESRREGVEAVDDGVVRGLLGLLVQAVVEHDDDEEAVLGGGDQSRRVLRFVAQDVALLVIGACWLAFKPSRIVAC